MPGVYATTTSSLGTSHTWAGRFFDFTRPDGYTAGLMPLAFAWRRGTASKVLTPIFYRQADSAARLRRSTCSARSTAATRARAGSFGLFPLFFAGHDGDGTWRAGVFPLFWASRSRTDATLVDADPAAASCYPSGKRVYVGPFYYRRDAEQYRRRALFPLVYFGKNHTAGARRVRAAALPRRAAATKGASCRLHAADLALSQRRARPRRRPAAVLRRQPLRRVAHHRRSCRSSCATADIGRGTPSSRVPAHPDLVAHARRSRRHRRRRLPALLALRRQELDDGGWRRWCGTSSAASRAPPSPSRSSCTWHRPKRDGLLVLNVYYHKGHRRSAGTWHLDVFPFVQAGRPRKHDLEWSLFEGLFGYQRQGRNRNLRLFWVLDFALEPVPASNLSWFGSTSTQSRELFLAPTTWMWRASRQNRVEALTGARAVAGLYILFFHFGGPLFARAPAWAETLRSSGWAATSYFIMLSGFVLTIAYGGKLADGTLGPRRFLAARVARFYPCYALALVLLLPMAFVHRWGATSATFGDASLKAKVATGLAQATMAHVLVPRLVISWNLPGWCVSIEMWFYVAFPVAVAWMLSRRGRTLVAVAAGMWAVAMTISIAYTIVEPDGFRPVHDSSAPWLTFFKFTPYARWPEFFFGCALGALWTHLPDERRGQRLPTALLAGGTLVAVALLVAGARIPYTLMHNGALLPCYGAIVWGLMLGHGPLHRVLALRPLTTLGESSYTLYTLQLPLMAWLLVAAGRHSGAIDAPFAALAIVLVVAAAITVHYVFEVRVQAWLRPHLERWAARVPLPSLLPKRAIAG